MDVAQSVSTNTPPPLGINRKFASPTRQHLQSANARQLGISWQNWRTKTDQNVQAEEALQKKKRAQKGQLFRAWLAMRQRQEILKADLGSVFRSLVRCGAGAVPAMVQKKDGSMSPTGSPGVVQLAYYSPKNAAVDGEKARVGLAWVQKCGSPMLCFMDAPKIRWHRSEEIKIICEKMLSMGYTWQYWTFTAPHDLSTDPDVQVKRMANALRKLKAGKAWDAFSSKYGIEYFIRAIEFTDDSPMSYRKTGAHFHYHFIIFMKTNKEISKNDVKNMKDFISKRWIACLEKEKFLDSSKKNDALKYAFRLDVPRKPKNKECSLQELLLYQTKGASCEMTPGIFAKNGKVPSRITHWELMALALTRFPKLVPRMLSVMQALKGRQWIRYDKGLAELCKIRIKTDQEILEEKIAPSITDFDYDIWQGIDKYKSQYKLVQDILQECENRKINIENLPTVNDGRDLNFDNSDADLLRATAEFCGCCLASGYDPATGELLEDLLKDPPKIDDS